MKLLHTADLHIGKVVNEFSMIEDQKYILQQIIDLAIKEEVDGILIAGDIYDRSVPPADAVVLLDWFLNSLIKNNIKIYMISGNHDSAQRLGFASKLLEEKGLYIGSNYDGSMKRIRTKKDEVTVDIYLLPFLKPQTVAYYEDDEDAVIRTFEDGVRASLSHVAIDHDVVNVLVTHHFVTSANVLPEQSDSENQLSLGGIDQVDTSVFDSFDYVALGHIHRPQRIGRDTIRYAGSPLKYSFSEVLHKKSVTLLEINPNKEILISTKALEPLHDMRKIKGCLNDLMNPEYYELADTNDYIQATLTDEVELVDPIGRLRSIYPNIMQIILEKNQKNINHEQNTLVARKHKSALELFEDFYTQVTGRKFDERRQKIMEEVFEEVAGGDQQ